MTIFEIAPLIAAFFGISCGAKFGSEFGQVGAWLGGLVGGILGWFCWRLPLMWLAKRLDQKRNFSSKTIEELRTILHDPNCRNPNVVLLELGTRGEKMELELPVVLNLLVSPAKETRIRGWQTLASVFPERAKIISDYRIDDSVEKCQEKVQKLLPIQT
jgi:hypothetical protein